MCQSGGSSWGGKIRPFLLTREPLAGTAALSRVWPHASAGRRERRMFMRHRIDVATLRLLFLGVAASSPSAAVTYRYKVTVSGSLTHNFQANGDDPCAP